MSITLAVIIGIALPAMAQQVPAAERKSRQRQHKPINRKTASKTQSVGSAAGKQGDILVPKEILPLVQKAIKANDELLRARLKVLESLKRFNLKLKEIGTFDPKVGSLDTKQRNDLIDISERVSNALLAENFSWGGGDMSGVVTSTVKDQLSSSPGAASRNLADGHVGFYACSVRHFFKYVDAMKSKVKQAIETPAIQIRGNRLVASPLAQNSKR